MVVKDIATYNSENKIGVSVDRGEMHITTEQTPTLATADQYYKLTGFSGANLNNFVVSDNKITFNGTEKVFHINGVSDIQVNKTCTLTYAVYVNGVINPHEITPHTFTSASKTVNISIVALATLSPNDYIEIWAKSTASNTELVISKLDVVLWGDVK